MSFTKEFKEFTLRGNVIDLAVAVVIGAAFGAIVASFVNDIIMPPIGVLLGGMNFADLKYILKAATTDASGKPIPAATINYGAFIQTIINFVIIALAIFSMIKAMNSMKKKKIEEPPTAPVLSTEEKLLMEIRDILSTQNK
jgi:large conductance mechanosensitive channel